MGLAVCCMKNPFSQQHNPAGFVRSKVRSLAKTKAQDSERMLNPDFIDTKNKSALGIAGRLSSIMKRTKRNLPPSAAQEVLAPTKLPREASVDSETVQHKLVRDIMYPDVTTAKACDKGIRIEELPQYIKQGGVDTFQGRVDAIITGYPQSIIPVETQNKLQQRHEIGFDTQDAAEKEIPNAPVETSAKVVLEQWSNLQKSRTPISLKMLHKSPSNSQEPRSKPSDGLENQIPSWFIYFCRYKRDSAPSIISIKGYYEQSDVSSEARSYNCESAQSDMEYNAVLPRFDKDSGLNNSWSSLPPKTPAPEIKIEPEALPTPSVQFTPLQLPKIHNISESQVTICRRNLMRIAAPSTKKNCLTSRD